MKPEWFLLDGRVLWEDSLSVNGCVGFLLMAVYNLIQFAICSISDSEVFGYGNLGSGNTILIDGTHCGWGDGARPFAAAGAAAVTYQADSASNGVLLTGETAAGTTPVSLPFTWDATNIRFAPRTGCPRLRLT